MHDRNPYFSLSLTLRSNVSLSPPLPLPHLSPPAPLRRHHPPLPLRLNPHPHPLPPPPQQGQRHGWVALLFGLTGFGRSLEGLMHHKSFS